MIELTFCFVCLFLCLCFTSLQQRGHLEMAPWFTVPCEGREARWINRSHRNSNPGRSCGSPLHYRGAKQALLTFCYYLWGMCADCAQSVSVEASFAIKSHRESWFTFRFFFLLGLKHTSQFMLTVWKSSNEIKVTYLQFSLTVSN